MQRIIVVGTSGAGKSTLAHHIAQKLKLTHIEMDGLFWNANWTPTSEQEMYNRLQTAMGIAENGWTMDGNYSRYREFTWSHADTIIWLDYSIWVIYWRILTRTIRRIITRQELWNGNRESFHSAFLSKDSIIWWAHTTYQDNRDKYMPIFASEDYPHLTFIRFTSPKQTQQWLDSL